MPLLFSQLSGRPALAWLKHRRWWMFFGHPSPSIYEIPRVTGDGTERVTAAGVVRVVRARARRVGRVTADGQERVTAGGEAREIVFAT